jgi:hypothetical protein
MKPSFGRPPLTFDRGRRDAHDLRKLLDIKSGEEPQFHQAALPRVELCQPIESLVKRNHILGIFRADEDFRVDVYLPRIAAAPFAGKTAPRMIHENLTHDVSRNGEEVSTILPRARLSPGKAHVCLMYQGRRLKSVTRTFALHVGPSHASHLVIDERNELTGGVPVPLAELRE